MRSKKKMDMRKRSLHQFSNKNDRCARRKVRKRAEKSTKCERSKGKHVLHLLKSKDGSLSGAKDREPKKPGEERGGS